MTILVTGATGTVGRHVVDQLLKKGIKVRTISRNPEKADLPAGVEVVAGDLAIPESLEAALQGVTALHLLASSYNFQTDPKVVEMAERAGVKRVSVLVSDTEGPVEEALANSGMEWTLLKPVEFMSNAIVDWQESIRLEGVVREPFGNALSRKYTKQISRVFLWWHCLNRDTMGKAIISLAQRRLRALNQFR